MLSRKNISFLNLAARVAETGRMETKHCAVIVKAGSVLSVAVNSRRNDYSVTEPDRCRRDGSIHAEAAAIKNCKNPKGATIIVARINRQGLLRLSKPCARCSKLIKSAGIKRIIYSIDEKVIGTVEYVK
jgi:tRNA(Arg) A34 adenosine deaminase TadA